MSEKNMGSTPEILKCPVCGEGLYRESGSLYCRGGRRHCYDISSSGYVNLCPGRATGGDDRGAVRSRTEFLALGYYEPIAKKYVKYFPTLRASPTSSTQAVGRATIQI